MSNTAVSKGTDAPIFFKAGSVIFGQGQNSKFLYIVKKGQVRLIKINGQKLSVLKLCKEREILNEVSVLTSKPTEFAAIAKTDVELVLVEKSDIQTIIKAGPSWIPEIFQTLCERLKSTQDIIDEHQLVSGEKNPEVILSKEEEKKCLQALLDNANH